METKKTKKKLKELTESQKLDIVKQVNTEVTSISAQEKNGQEFNIPGAEQLVLAMSQDLVVCRKEMAQLMPLMSKKAISRAVLAITDLPHDDLPVLLKTEEEKKFFVYGQRAFMAKMVIIKHHTDKLALVARNNQQKEVENV